MLKLLFLKEKIETKILSYTQASSSLTKNWWKIIPHMTSIVL